MFALIPITFSSLLVCFVLTPFFRDFFGFLGVVDTPDSNRKIHLRPVPRVGGVALIIAYLGAFCAVALGGWRGFIDPSDPAIRLVVKLTPAIVLIFAIGLYDDLRGLSPWQKLAGQFCAALYASWIGIRLTSPPGYGGPAFLVDVVGIAWLVLCTNAFNLIDGLDGLATGVALIASTSLLLAALIHHNPGLAFVITPLMGALVGFLYYNFNPASIFLGDCGSLLIGFLIGCYGVMLNQHAGKGLGMFAPFIALAFPVFEVTLSVVRRYIRNRPIFSSDKNHIHHRILSLGLSHRNTALVLYGVAALVAIVAVLQTILQPQFATALLLLFVAAAILGFRVLRYPEFGILRKFLFSGGLRRTLRTDVHLHDYEESLATAATVEDCWQVLNKICREANFTYVSLRVDDRYFEDDLQPAFSAASHLRISLSGWDEATFGHDPHLLTQAMLIAPLAERLQEKLVNLKSLSGWLASESVSREVPKASRAVVGG